jgi:hypothetical protein
MTHPYQCHLCGCPLQPMSEGGDIQVAIVAHYKTVHPEVAQP